MIPQEQQMLNDLLGRIAQAPAATRDAEADAMIQRALGSRPDALYLLTQLALVNDIALKNAQQQIQSLQQRSQPSQSSSFFLGPWGGGQANAPQQQQPAYAPASGGFLHNALTTASGVIAGEVAFSALRSLFGGGMGGGFGTGGGSFLSGAPGSETTVNNYYGDRADSNNFAGNSDNTNYTDDSSDLASADDGSNDFSDDSNFT